MSWIKFGLTIILAPTLFIFGPNWYPWVEVAVKLVTCITLAWFISLNITHYLCRWILPKVSPHKKGVLITGCDSGFGHNTALRLNKEGFFVFAGLLNANATTVSELKEKAHDPDRLICLQLDVTNDYEVSEAYHKVRQVISDPHSNVEKLYALVNNAGIALASLLEGGGTGSQDVYLKHLQVNTMGVIRVTKAFLPLLREAKQSRIVNVSSMAARINTLMLNPYAVSKAASSKFTEGLQDELSYFGVKTIGVEPWFFKTPLTEPGRLVDTLMATFEASGDEVRTAYANKIAPQKAVLEVTMDSPLIVQRNPRIITDTITSALMSFEPDVVYRIIPWHHRISLWIIIDFLPWEVLIFFKTTFQTLGCWLAGKKSPMK